MFGLLISGRLVDTNFRTVDPTHVLIDIPDANSFHHVVVFLTGQQPFPNGMGGAVYFNWPSPDSAEPSWQLLGSLTNEKPSAIFKVSKLKPTNDDDRLSEDMSLRFGQMCQPNMSTNVHQPGLAQLGISVESIANLQGQTPAKEAEASSLPTFVEFSQKMLDNLFNYSSSFAMSSTELMASIKTSETYVPFSAIKNWYGNFERRLHQNPYFWKL